MCGRKEAVSELCPLFGPSDESAEAVGRIADQLAIEETMAERSDIIAGQGANEPARRGIAFDVADDGDR